MDRPRLIKILKHIAKGITIALLFVIFFAPMPNQLTPRNLPQLITVLVLIAMFCAWKICKLGLLVVRVVSLLKSQKFQIVRQRCGIGQYLIEAERGFERYVICLVARRINYVRYHFESIEKIEFYKRARDFAITLRGSGRQVKGGFRTRKIGEKSLKWTENVDGSKRFLIFDKHPWQMTDSKRKEELDDGICICGSDVTLYDLETFSRYLSQE